MNDKSAMMTAFALCPLELAHTDKMQWIANKFRLLTEPSCHMCEGTGKYQSDCEMRSSFCRGTGKE